MQVWQMVSPKKWAHDREVRCVFSPATKLLNFFLPQAENIYNDEDPEGAADSEVQA